MTARAYRNAVSDDKALMRVGRCPPSHLPGDDELRDNAVLLFPLAA